MYDEVSRNAHNGETNAKKLITRPIMTVTSPNSPHIALTYTKMRFDNFFDQTYPPSWSKLPYVLKVGWFSCPVRKVTKIPGFPQPNFTKWLWFLAIFHTRGYVRMCGKFPNLNIFAPFGLWKSSTKKVPCPVHKNQKQCVLVFGCFVVVFVVVFVFFFMNWSNIIILSPPEHRKHHLNLKWGDLIFWFRPISCTHFATPQHMVAPYEC